MVKPSRYDAWSTGALALVDAVGPITATSANMSGEVPALDTEVCANQLVFPLGPQHPAFVLAGLAAPSALRKGPEPRR